MSEVQDLGDVVPDLLKIKAKANVPIRFHVRIELGDGKTLPSPEVTNKANELLKRRIFNCVRIIGQRVKN